jgi:hypothetical protein
MKDEWGRGTTIIVVLLVAIAGKLGVVPFSSSVSTAFRLTIRAHGEAPERGYEGRGFSGSTGGNQ